jgi:hypothetical protein
MTHPLSEAGTSVEVKPLEWRSTHAGEAPVWRADTVMGRYTVVKGSAWGPEPSNTTWHCTDDEDGKARCQADFKTRILSALIQPTPAETDCPECGRHVQVDPQPASGFIAHCGRRLTRIGECQVGPCPRRAKETVSHG